MLSLRKASSYRECAVGRLPKTGTKAVYAAERGGSASSIRRMRLFDDCLEGLILINTWTDISAVAGEDIQRSHQLVLGIGLQDVTAGPRTESAAHQFGGGMQGKQQNLGVGQNIANDAGGLEAV